MEQADRFIEKLLESEKMRAQYEIGPLLGSGAMGDVYRAVHRGLARPVALKLIRAETFDTEGRERFHREARLSARIIHPNVVVVFDYGEVDGIPYIAFELIDGPSLRRVLERGPLSLEESIRICKETAEGLAAAHREGIIHRDVKAENILLAGGTQVKVADFGISRPQRDSRLTSPGIVLGSPAYMSPEQITARPLTATTDQYSLGVMLYEMVAGEYPFKGSPSEVLTQHLREEPPIAKLESVLPERLLEVLKRLLTKEPLDRYDSMGEVATALARAGLGLAVRSPVRAAGPAVLQKTVRTDPRLLPPRSESQKGIEKITCIPARDGSSFPWRRPISGLILAVAVVSVVGVRSMRRPAPPRILIPTRPPVETPAIEPSTVDSPGLVKSCPRPSREAPGHRDFARDGGEDSYEDYTDWNLRNYASFGYPSRTVIYSIKSRRKIYHLYGITKAQLPKPENHRRFKSEEEAKKAGYRRAKR